MQRNVLLPIFFFLFLALVWTGTAQQVQIQDDADLNPMLHVEKAPAGGTGMHKTLGMWSSGAKIPVAKKFHTVASHNGMIYVFGGVTTGNYFNNKCYKYSPGTDTWSPIRDFPRTNWLYGTAQTVNGKIYIMGGLNNLGSGYQTVPTVYEYDPAADTYMTKQNMPYPQGFVSSGVIDDKIYIVAGSGQTNNDYVTRVQVYDPAADSWSTATEYPRNVRYTSAATVNNTIVVTGGYNVNYTPTRYIGDTYVGAVSGGTLSWTKVKDYSIGPTIFISGVGVGDKAYFFGGRPSIDGNAPATQRSFIYTPATDTWETIELKPTGIQTLIQAGTDGSKVYAPGGEDANASAVDVMEVLDISAQGGPSLVMDITSLLVAAKKGTNVSRQVALRNNGSGPLTWSVAFNPANNWVSPSQSNGTVQPFGADAVTLQFSSSVATGEYKADMILTTNDPTKQTVTIPVTYVVQDEDINTDPVVLFEEGTGTWCGYCPYGADSVEAILQRYPGRVAAVSYHGGSSNEPMLTPITATWVTNIGLTGWPSAAANRLLFTGNQNIALVNRAQWSSYVEWILNNYRSPVSLNIVSKGFNPSTRQISLTIDVFFHQPMQDNIRLCIAQTEDNLNWTQVFYPPTGGSTKIYPYYHKHTLRQMIPDAYGEVIGNGSYIQSQSSVRKAFTFASKDSLAENSRLVIIAHISDGNSYGPILQAKEITMNSLTDVYEPSIVEEFCLSQNYPNPFNPSTVVSYSLPKASFVTLTVSDMLGREIRTLVSEAKEAGTYHATFDAANLPSGFYLYTIKAGDYTESRKMLLMK